MKVEKIYYWRDLTGDGLLKAIEPEGPHYDEVDINGYCGYYESEEAAVEGLLAFKKKFGSFWWLRNIILITEYKVRD